MNFWQPGGLVLAPGGFLDVVDQLLHETKAGVSGQTKEDTKALPLQLYQEYKSNGAVSYAADQAEINKYNHREMAKKFASILDTITR